MTAPKWIHGRDATAICSGDVPIAVGEGLRHSTVGTRPLQLWGILLQLGGTSLPVESRLLHSPTNDLLPCLARVRPPD